MTFSNTSFVNYGCQCVLITIGKPGDDLRGELQGVSGEHVAGLAYGVVSELKVAVQQVAANVFEHATQVAH